MMAKDSESISQLEKGSSKDVPMQNEIDVQHSEKATTKRCKGDTGRVGAMKNDVNIKKARSSKNSGDVSEPLSAKEIKDINILVRDLSLLSRRPLIYKCQHYIPPRDVSDAVRELAHVTLFSSLRCRLMRFSMQEAITVAEERIHKAFQIAKVVELDKSATYQFLAYEYDAVIQHARRRIYQLGVAAQSAERAAIAARSAVNQMTEVSDRTSNATSRILAAHSAGNVAHKTNIVAYSALYASLETMKMCWQDLSPELVETSLIPEGEPFESKPEKSFNLNTSIILNSFIVCVLIANARSRIIPLSCFSLRFALEAIGMGHLLYKTGMFFCEKLRVWKIEKKISNIDERLRILGVILGN